MKMIVNIDKLCKDDFLNLSKDSKDKNETQNKYVNFFREAIGNYLESTNFKHVATGLKSNRNKNCISRMYSLNRNYVSFDIAGSQNANEETMKREVYISSDNADFMIVLLKHIIEVTENYFEVRGVSKYLSMLE